VKRGSEIVRPAWSEPTDESNETEQDTGKDGTSRKASFTKMKSMREGEDEKERQEMDPSGTVETNPWSSNQASRDATQGDVCLPPGLHVSECVLKLPARRTGVETSGMRSSK
jgi:hypothetical protein